MDLPRLFHYQSRLNRRIIEKRGLKGERERIETQRLALLVEIGELANSWRGFKVWQTDRSPRRPEMLEEYSDCLHFFASTGLKLGVDPAKVKMQAIRLGDTISQFRELFRRVSGMETPEDWEASFQLFLGLGEMLGLSDEEIKQAYLRKHEINYRRLEEAEYVHQ